VRTPRHRTTGRRASRLIRASLIVGIVSASLSAVTAQVAEAATDTVTTCAGTGPGSLPAVVAAAAPGDTIDFSVSCPPGSPITLTSTITLAQNVIIAGPGASTMAVSGNNAVGVFIVSSGVNASISGLTIEDGQANNGGAIDNADGTTGSLTVTDTTFTHNTAVGNGGAIDNGDNSGNGTLIVTDSTFSNNTAETNNGGAIDSGDALGHGTVTVTDSTFTGNAGSSGGAILSIAGDTATGSLSISGSTFSSNTAVRDGGAIDSADYQGTATLTVTDSTFSNNTAQTRDGGAIDNADGQQFSGDSKGTATITNSTFSANSAPDDDGGTIDNGDTTVGPGGYGTMTFTNSTLSGGGAGVHGGNIDNGDNGGSGTLNLGATIVANPGAGGDCALSGGTFTDLGYNLADDATCGLSGTGDLPHTAAGLDPTSLQNNGGPTETIALESGSAAIRAVADPSLCPSTDQRGYPRNVPCDIGAYDTDTIVAPCTPGTTGCSATVSVPSQTVAVTGTKPVTDSASITLVVATAVLSCENFSYAAPVVTLTDTGLQAGTGVLVTDTVKGLPSKKGVVICYQPVEASPPPPVFLAKCHGSHFVGACYKSVAETAGSVVAKLELPAGDPRYHVGGETPDVTSISPASPRPGKKLTIKGENLSEVTGVTIGGIPATITKAAPTHVSVIVPQGTTGGVVVVSSSAGVVSGPSVTVSGARVPPYSSKLTRGEHRRH